MSEVNPIFPTPAVEIRREHQSAPAEHYVDKAMREAAEEIADGRYIPPRRDLDELHLALRAGLTEDTYDPKTVTPADFESTAFSLDLAYHPRVAEALDRLAQEKETASNSQELIEKTQMLWELNENAQKKNRWPGQERWLGAENREKRIGLILNPLEFFRRLCMVTGNDRLFISRHVVLESKDSKSGRVALLIRNPDKQSNVLEMSNQRLGYLRGELSKAERRFRQVRDLDRKVERQAEVDAVQILLEAELSKQPRQQADDFLQVATLQSPNNTEWMIPYFDQWGVPTVPEYIGWRTALLSLIRLRVITEKEAHRAFPVRGGHDASEWYFQQIWDWRNGRGAA
jgi:hypothetical protein